jgi:hypothetical protein
VLHLGNIVIDKHDIPARFFEFHNVPYADRKRGNVNLSAIDEKMAMGHKLPGTVPVRRKPHPVNHIVQPRLKKLKQHFTGHTFFPLSPAKSSPELFFKKTINFSDFLFFPELNTIVRKLAPALAMLSGRILSPLNSALLCIASIPFEEKLFRFPTADPA